MKRHMLVAGTEGRSRSLLSRGASSVALGCLVLGCLDRKVAPTEPETTHQFVDQIVQFTALQEAVDPIERTVIQLLGVFVRTLGDIVPAGTALSLKALTP